MTQPSPTTAPHVVHGVISLDCGGLERIVADLVRIGRSKSRQVSVICLERPGVLAGEIQSMGAKLICLEKPPGLLPELIDKAAKVLADLRPNILHTHQIGVLWYLGAAARRTGRWPILHTEHIDHVAKAPDRWRKFKTRMIWHRASRYANKFCCVSNDVANSARRFWTVPASKVEVVLNGIDTERFARRAGRDATRAQYKIPPEAIVIGNVARVTEVKRQDLLLRGFAALAPENPNLHLLFVGDGDQRQNLEQLSDQLGVRQRTTFAGYQSETERFLAAMDIFALTSRLEGLPLALLEAWAAGLPVISTAVGGIPKVVENGKTGLLFASGDQPALEAALRQIITDPARAAQLGEAGRAVVRRDYSLERMAADYDRYYAELIGAAK
ncbi:MAG TPA: glycosyltransferase [Tepidisphaeraceae bacterium]|nr:glycosyltransferase [Tepidisphaeraceae bacterium]